MWQSLQHSDELQPECVENGVYDQRDDGLHVIETAPEVHIDEIIIKTQASQGPNFYRSNPSADLRSSRSD